MFHTFWQIPDKVVQLFIGNVWPAGVEIRNEAFKHISREKNRGFSHVRLKTKKSALAFFIEMSDATMWRMNEIRHLSFFVAGAIYWHVESEIEKEEFMLFAKANVLNAKTKEKWKAMRSKSLNI